MLAVALAGIALSLTPGPSMLYVLSRSVGQSRAAGLASAIGLGLGGVLLAVASAFGLTVVFAAFEWLVPLLRWIGSAYLVWLGVGIIRDTERTASTPIKAQDVPIQPFGRIVQQGIWIEILNPKTVLFFALFLPPFINPDSGSVPAQLLVLGILVPLTAVPSDLAVAWMGGTAADRINRSKGWRRMLGWIGGLTLIAIAANLHVGIW
jgi:threonine/homoserine/homoserine lactone efflux protein